jgi:hypothetical protein
MKSSILRRIQTMAEYKFPVAIGDTVTAVVEDEDHVVDIIHYEVCGVAQVGNKQYVIDKHGESFEIGSRLCLVEERDAKA